MEIVIRSAQRTRTEMLYFFRMEASPKNLRIDKTALRVFSSFEEAEAADKEYYHSLSPAQRMEILFILRDQYSPYDDEFTYGFKRVCRIVEQA